MRAACAPEFAYADRCRLNLLEGDLEMMLVAVRERAASGPRLSYTPVASAGDHLAVFTLIRRFGTLREGGEFESEYLEIFGVRDGRATHLELYELDDLERAVARTTQLNAGMHTRTGMGA